MIHEVIHGSWTRYLEASNPIHACFQILESEAQSDNVQLDAFIVTPTGGTTTKYQLDVILKLRLLALNPYDVTLYDELAAPCDDLSPWDATTYRNS